MFVWPLPGLVLGLWKMLGDELTCALCLVAICSRSSLSMYGRQKFYMSFVAPSKFSCKN